MPPTADEAHNADGKHVACLTPGRSAGRLRQLDPDLYDRFARIVVADPKIGP